MRARTRFRRLLSSLELARASRWILLSTLLGVVVGLAAAGFQEALELAGRVLFDLPVSRFASGEGSAASSLPPWLLLLLPAAGAGLSARLTSWLAPEAGGHGTDAVVRAYHREEGRVGARVAPVKLVASMLTLGTGGSGGREGPIAQVGSAIGSRLASLFGLAPRDRRVLLLAGAAAGVGAIFRAPLGGALFASEVLYRGPGFEGSAVFSNVIAAITSYSVFSVLRGEESLFRIHPYAFEDPTTLPFFAVLGAACAAVGILYVWTFYRGASLFRRAIRPPWLRAAAGGLGLGLLALAFRPVAGDDRILLSGGYGLAQRALDVDLGPAVLLALVGAKMLATTSTIASGGSGGVFAPSLAIGASLGGAFGLFAHRLFPAAAPDPGVCALVGMGGFFAGVAKTPLTAVILVSEMTGSYGLLVPMMLVAALACILSSGWSIYREQVASRLDSPAHLGELAAGALARMRVADAIDPSRPLRTIPASMTLREIAGSEGDREDSRPVVDEEGCLVGLLAPADLHRALREPALGRLLLARDLARESAPSVTPERDLRVALRLLAEHHEEDLLVVDPADRRRPLAVLSRQDLLAAYERRIREG